MLDKFTVSKGEYIQIVPKSWTRPSMEGDIKHCLCLEPIRGRVITDITKPHFPAMFHDCFDVFMNC